MMKKQVMQDVFQELRDLEIVSDVEVFCELI